ncbi:MAG: hypothetical protein ALECFALPRED_011074 [Alectoria fallacina]|uniref:cellulase n=1 Tax=Alectoria fallacina TaxID=1903189 RepID=A0A8H3J9Z0_9LECA|nr:MAG: hypothetical protein ALECFALPRED_011074 [Alectoria fallacina]
MKDSHLALVSLLAGSAPICQALSMPHWGSEPDTRLEKRLQRVAYAGINIAGCDFGMQTNGDSGTPDCPSSVGPTQMQHFATNDHLNLFRLPVGWPYLVNYELGGPLYEPFFSTYDALMQACLATGALCILDVHNYARWYGGIIGQGGPTNDQFGNLWAQLAQKYASQKNVVFGLMNEPHDLVMTTWAATVQNAIYAIRDNGATTQMILLSGTNYDAVGGFQTNSAPALSSVVDYDGTQNKLIYEAHQYLDGDGGALTECITNGVTNQLAPLTTYLRSVGRQAMLTETGGGNTASCFTDVCAELSHLNWNNDVWLGWVGWAAGSFDSSYNLTESPNGNVDTALVTDCIAGKFNNPP